MASKPMTSLGCITVRKHTAKLDASESEAVRLTKPLPAEAIEPFHQRFLAADIDALFTGAVEQFGRFDMDRKAQFLGRLYLAALQYHHERGQHVRAAQWLQRLCLQDRLFTDQSALDLGELIAYDFSIRGFYQLDTLAA